MKKLVMGVVVLACVAGGWFWWRSGNTIVVGAGAAPSENIFKRIQGPIKQDLGIDIQLIDNGPYEAAVALDQGKVDAASGGVTTHDWKKLMTEKGYKEMSLHRIEFRTIGRDLVQVVANPNVTVTSLSREQLKGIFTGQIANWKDVGGPDQAISIVIGKEMPGTYNVFKNRMMDDAAYGGKTLDGKNAPDVKEKVKATPGGIGLLPVALVDATLNVLQTPEVDRPITLITKLNPPKKIQKMIDYIQGKGKQYTLPK